MKEKAQYDSLDKKRYLHSVAAAAGMLVALAGCEAPVTEGEIYQKTHIAEHATEEVFLNPYAVLPFKRTHPERWEVRIAQCPKGELPQQEAVEKECKTNSDSVPKKTYDELRVGEYYKIPPLKSSPLFQGKRLPGKFE